MSALYIVFVLWLLYGLLMGIGLLLRGLVLPAGGSLPRSQGMLTAFWTGFAVALALLQVWHLFIPVRNSAFLLLLLIGLVGWSHDLRREGFGLRTIPRLRLSRAALPVIGFVAGLSLIGLWIAWNALHTPPHYDDGLYHLQELQWVEHYAIIPGLGNLHGRFAFNNAVTLWFAALNGVPLLPEVRYLSSSLFIFAFVAQGLFSGWRVYRGDPHLTDALYLLCLIPTLYFITSTNISSLKNDLPVALLLIVASGELVRLAQPPRLTPAEQRYRAMQLMLLISAAVAIKLSGAALGLLLVLSYGVLLRHHRRRQLLTSRQVGINIGIVLAVGGAVLGIWMARGVLLSGYPLYPSTVLALPVDWRVDPQVAYDEATGVASWARNPGGDPAVVLASWDWLPVWWELVLHRPLELLVPLAVGLLALVGGLIYTLTRRVRFALRATDYLLLLPPTGAALFWFVSAPDTRFGWYTLWLLAAGLVIVVGCGSSSVRGLRLPVMGTSAGLLAVVLLNLPAARAAALPTDAAKGAAVETAYPDAPLQNFYTYHGVRLYVPVYGAQCWEAAQPCTPYPDYLVQAREPGGIQKGFRRQAIASDKTAFSLVEINQVPDIVPTEDVLQLQAGRLPANGILVGRGGWHSLEDWGDGRQRWLEDGAEIYITRPDALHRQLCLTVAPGPSVLDLPVRVRLLDEAGSAIAYTYVEDEEVIHFKVPTSTERVQILRLHVDYTGRPTPGDGRILNLRVMQIDWCADQV